METGSGVTRERIHKVLASRGFCSRRAAEQLVVAGRVTVNGSPAVVGQTVIPGVDVITVDGQLVAGSPAVEYLALNKPAGVVTTLQATHGESTVRDLVNTPSRVFPVGRLDRDTSGLLLLTNDGEWANLVTHPRYEVEKEYYLLLRGAPSESVVERLRMGVRLPDGSTTSPARVRRLGSEGGNGRLSVTVVEGKKRQIRLMAAAVGFPVLRLQRVRVGPVVLGDLGAGCWRPLNDQEVEGIRAHGRRPAGASRCLLATDCD